jgi:hypothetical protein
VESDVLPALADEHISDALAAALRLRGCDVVQVKERDLQGTPDEDLLALAFAERRVVLTNDTDFVSIAARLQQQGAAFAPVLFWPQQRRTLSELLATIVSLIDGADYDVICSQVYYL